MTDSIFKPRHLAAMMIEDFLEGGQVQVNPEDFPSEIRAPAITMARNTAAIIIHHARVARKDRGYIRRLPDHLRVMVMTYEDNNHKRRKPDGAPN